MFFVTFSVIWLLFKLPLWWFVFVWCMRKYTKHWRYTSDAEKLVFLNHCALKYCEHYACQKFLWMPLKMCLQVSSIASKNSYHRHFSLSWVMACTEPFIYHDTNFHWGFVINVWMWKKLNFGVDFVVFWLFLRSPLGIFWRCLGL